MLKQMWEKLDAHTVAAADGRERAINVRNEWGGFSRRLSMPVFTGWQDHVTRQDGQTKVLVLDTSWSNKAGVNNRSDGSTTACSTMAKRRSSGSRRSIRRRVRELSSGSMLIA